MGQDDSLDLAGFSLHWTRHSIKAVGCYTEKHGPIDFDLPTLAEGYYDEAKVHSPWYDREVERRADDPAAVAQELDIAFLSSGYPVFKPEWSRRHLERVQEPIQRTQPIIDASELVPVVSYDEREDGELFWFAELDATGVYCCGVDTAEGLGNQASDPDYSAIRDLGPGQRSAGSVLQIPGGVTGGCGRDCVGPGNPVHPAHHH